MDVEFKLFGSLTVRQFLYLAGSIVLAVMIYFIQLPLILGLPIIASVILIGLAMTFVTVNGQSFSRWFSSFVLALFTPQKYVWKKQAKTPKVLIQSAKPKKVKKTLDSKSQKELGVLPLLDMVAQKAIKVDKSEEEDLSRIDRYFQAEYDKYNPESKDSSAKQGYQSERLDLREGGVANYQNPIGKGQIQVKVGPNQRQAYSEVRNTNPRVFNPNADIETLVEDKVKSILRKQKELDQYTGTKQIEEEEKKLKNEMKEMYEEIQKLKKSNGE